MKEDVRKMVGNVENLNEIWETMDTCYERPEKYITEPLGQVVEFQKYKVADSSAVRDCYSLLMTAILGGKAVGHLRMFKMKTPSSIMGRCQHLNRKE
jgi:hypothetical protein